MASASQRERALSRWENEGGADGQEPPHSPPSVDGQAAAPDFTQTELARLRMRVIALENLVMALLAGATSRQQDLAREMSAYISPRPGFTPHPLTTQAADHMLHLLGRANEFRGRPPAARPYRTTRVLTERTLPAGLRREHRTKPGVWAVIRVLDGRVRYRVLSSTPEMPASEVLLEPGHPGLVLPDQPHLVEPLGPVRLQIEFYRELPEL